MGHGSCLLSKSYRYEGFRFPGIFSCRGFLENSYRGDTRRYSDVLMHMPEENPAGVWIANRKSIHEMKSQLKKVEYDGKNCKALISLLEKATGENLSSTDSFANLGDFSMGKSSSKMMVASLLTIIIELSAFYQDSGGSSAGPPTDTVNDSIEACCQAWQIMELLEKSGSETVAVNKQADKIFHSLKESRSWMGLALPINNFQPRTVEAAKRAVQGLADKVKQTANTGYESKNWKTLMAGNSLYKLCDSMKDYSVNAQELLNGIQSSLGDVIRSCIFKMGEIIVDECRLWAEAFMEDELWDALYEAGRAKGITQQLQPRIKVGRKLDKELRKQKLFNAANACSSVSCAYQSLSTTFYHRYCFRKSENQISGTSSAFSVRECQSSQSVRAMAWQEPHSGVSRTGGTSPPMLSLTIHNNTVEVAAAPGVTDSELRKAFDSILFKQWINNMKSETGILALDDRCCLKKVLIQSLDMFGERVGFLKFKAEVVDTATGSKLPGIVFARGGSVAILMVLECDGESYVVLTEQARVPVGRTILELPAGMLDDDRGDFVGTAAREVEEETGIHISSGDLVNLTAFLDPSTGNKMFPSPGGSDEEISLLLYKGHVKKEVVEALRGRETGLRSHGELITLHIVPYKKLWRVTADSKALAAITLYEMAKKEGILPLQNTPELFSS